MPAIASTAAAAAAAAASPSPARIADLGVSALSWLAASASTPAINDTTNTTISGVPWAVCAWPVSGQYGIGSRILYYVLVAVCLFGRKERWLRGPCLVAALIFPAVAALHGIVLAALHVNEAIDLDIYGAFQFCAIGILTAPITVRLSSTYFNDPGRNSIFLWTGVVLAGLLSLTVEFFRSEPFQCQNSDGSLLVNPDLANNPHKFLDQGLTCNRVCDPDNGPFSVLRRDAANNIYIIPAPTKLTFNMGAGLAAACCIPAILSMFFMWDKILEINWTRRHRDPHDPDSVQDEAIEGTNGATVRQMDKINEVVKQMLSFVEIPVFGGAVIALLVVGETNLNSAQLHYQTEPIGSVGQWAPIVGTLIAALGSLYLLRSKTVDALGAHRGDGKATHYCPHCNHDANVPPGSRPSQDQSSIDRAASPLTPTTLPSTDAPAENGGGRRNSRVVVSNMINKITAHMVGAAHTDLSEFQRGPAMDYPTTPGEKYMNPKLPETEAIYNPPRDADGNATPSVRRSRSRASSFRASFDGEAEPNTELDNVLPSAASTSKEQNRGRRRDTLDAPSSPRVPIVRSRSSTFPRQPMTVLARGPSSPAIVVSGGDETPFESDSDSPMVESPTTTAPIHPQSPPEAHLARPRPSVTQPYPSK